MQPQIDRPVDVDRCSARPRSAAKIEDEWSPCGFHRREYRSDALTKQGAQFESSGKPVSRTSCVSVLSARLPSLERAEPHTGRYDARARWRSPTTRFWSEKTAVNAVPDSCVATPSRRRPRQPANAATHLVITPSAFRPSMSTLALPGTSRQKSIKAYDTSTSSLTRTPLGAFRCSQSRDSSKYWAKYP
jgi:hypothetical protein